MLMLSVVNTKLRDHYASLDALCEDLQVVRAELEDTLRDVDYVYDEANNQFV